MNPLDWDSLNGREDVLAATLTLTKAANQSLHIYSRDLDSHLYDNQAFLDAITRLLTSSPHAEARILVRDIGSAIRAHHRLIGLHQRLSSKLLMRVPAPVHQDYNAAFLVADGEGMIYRPLADRYEADGGERKAARARQLIYYHDEVWEFAKEDPHLRRLHL